MHFISLFLSESSVMELVGHKTEAIVDLWSICHLLSGMALGSFGVGKLNSKSQKHSYNKFSKGNISKSVLVVVIIAYVWEFLEYFLEAGLAGVAVSAWFNGHEDWFNRLITDPLLLVIGYLVALKLPYLIWPARFLLIIWLYIFIFVFPHSMAYL